MKHFKKISAVVVALSVMVSSLVPTFAANTSVNGEKAVTLNQLELYAGTSTTSFEASLDTALTRGQGAVLLAKMFNMDSAAQALTDEEVNAVLKNFADADKVPGYAKKRLAYMVKNNIMSGVLNTATGELNINADEALLGGQFATLLLKQLGFSVANWNEAINQLSEVNGAKDIANYLSYETNTLLRDQAVGIMFGALTGKYATGSDTVIGKIVAAKPALQTVAQTAGLVAAPTTLAVESVKTLNLREMVITFNKAINATEAVKEANYKIDNNSPEDASVSADGKVVTLRTSSAKAMSNYDTDIELVMESELGFTADQTIKGISAKDTTVPTAVSVSTSGPRNIKVMLSEPLNEAASIANVAASMKIDSGLVAIDTASVTLSGRELSFRTYSDLSEGSHKIEFISDANSTFVDNAGYKMEASSMTFDYVKDTSALAFSVVESNETSVTIKFNKAIKADTFKNNGNVLITHTYNTDTNQVKGDSGAITTTDDQKFVITFGETKPFPPAATTVYIKYDSDTGKKIEDNYGNKLAATSFAVTTAADVTKPTAAAEFVDANTVKVTFSEDVNGVVGGTNSALNTSNYVLKNGSDVVALKSAAFDTDSKKVVKLTTNVANALNGTTYTLTVKNVKDLSVAKNQIDEVTLTFSGTDKVAPYVVTADSKLVAANKYKVVFSEAMDVASITDKSVYRINGAALVTDDTLEVTDANKAVVITFKTAPALASNTLDVARVKDVAGNWTEAFNSALTFDTTVSTIGLNEYQITGKNAIKLKFKDTLKNMVTTDFAYTTGAGAEFIAPDALSVSIVDGVTYITLVTKDIPSATGDGVEVKSVGTTKTESTYGTKVSFNTADPADTLVIVDKRAPEVVSYACTADQDDKNETSTAKSLKTIQITYNEAIYAASVQDTDYTVAGYTISNVSVAGNVVTITLENVEYGSYVLGTTEVKVKQVGEIQDAAKNALAAQDEWTVK